MYKPGKEAATRIELRSPDPACNSYLAYAAMLAAGLKGIDESYVLEAPVEEDIFRMDEAERREKGIDSLPGSLIEAVHYLEKSTIVRDALGEHIFKKFIDNKKVEWDDYRTQITDYEIKRYFPLL
jgi:glutamine synthetase